MGVLEECRSLGLGSKLLAHLCEYVVAEFPKCDMLYSHVLDDDTQSSQFLLRKNEFDFLSIQEGFYEFVDRKYGALTFCKSIHKSKAKIIDHMRK